MRIILVWYTLGRLRIPKFLLKVNSSSLDTLLNQIEIGGIEIWYLDSISFLHLEKDIVWLMILTRFILWFHLPYQSLFQILAFRVRFHKWTNINRNLLLHFILIDVHSLTLVRRYATQNIRCGKEKSALNTDCGLIFVWYQLSSQWKVFYKCRWLSGQNRISVFMHCIRFLRAI